jgi:hypothetical protein
MGTRAVCVTVGLLLMILGGMPLFYIYAFASMVHPDLKGWDYWSEILRRMFDLSSAGSMSVLSSLIVLIGCGFFLWGLFSTLASAMRYCGNLFARPADRSPGR